MLNKLTSISKADLWNIQSDRDMTDLMEISLSHFSEMSLENVLNFERNRPDE